MSGIRVTLLGAGRVARDLVRLLASRPGVEVVAAWSRNPDHAGADIGDLAGSGRLGVAVTADRDAALAVPADVAVLATTSFLSELAPEVEAAVAQGRNVISTGEEAAYPWAVDHALAAKLDALAVARGVTILGAGVNPGFVFDALALTLSGAAWDVTAVRVTRVVDVSRFSSTVLGRLGIGFTPEDFAAGRAAGAIRGHIGFPQSMHVVAGALGRSLDRVEGTVEPIVASGTGRTAGFVQRYVGYEGAGPWFHAALTGHVDLAAAGLAPRDTIAIDGAVPLALSIDPGLDAQATVAAVLGNSLRRVVDAAPGWRTVAQLPPAFPR